MADLPWFIVTTCCQNGSRSLPGLKYMGWMGKVGVMALVWFQISRGNRDCWELSHNNNGSDREASTVAIFTLQLHRYNFTLLTQTDGYCVRTYTSFPRRLGRQQQALLNSGIAKKGGADQRQDFLDGLVLKSTKWWFLRFVVNFGESHYFGKPTSLPKLGKYSKR